MKKKVILPILLVLLLILAACNRAEDDTPADVDEPEATEEPAPPPEETVDPEDPEENGEDYVDSLYYDFPHRTPVDQGGGTLRINAWWLPHDFYADREPDDPGFKSINTIYREAEQRWNVNLEFTVAGWGENVELLATSVLAGEPFADMVRLENWQAMPYAVTRGLLTPLEEIPYNYFDIETMLDPGIRGFASFAGLHYGYVFGYQQGDGLFFNIEILERLGLPNPFELHEAGQWTWDTFRDMAARATVLAPDGSVEQYGVATNVLTFANYLWLTNGGNMVDEITQTFTGDSPNVVEALEFMQAMVLEDGSVSFTNEQDIYLAGNALFIPIGPWFRTQILEQMGPDFGWIPFPSGPRGDGRVHSVGWGANMYFVPRGANFAALTIYAESRAEAHMYWTQDPDAWAEGFSRCELSHSIIAQMRHSTLFDRFRGFGIYELMPWEDLGTGAAQPASTLEAIRVAAQEGIDEVFAPMND